MDGALLLLTVALIAAALGPGDTSGVSDILWIAVAIGVVATMIRGSGGWTRDSSRRS
jgi:hypothetical protein